MTSGNPSNSRFCICTCAVCGADGVRLPFSTFQHHKRTEILQDALRLRSQRGPASLTSLGAENPPLETPITDPVEYLVKSGRSIVSEAMEITEELADLEDTFERLKHHQPSSPRSLRLIVYPLTSIASIESPGTVLDEHDPQNQPYITRRMELQTLVTRLRRLRPRGSPLTQGRTDAIYHDTHKLLDAHKKVLLKAISEFQRKEKGTEVIEGSRQVVSRNLSVELRMCFFCEQDFKSLTSF